MVGFNLVSVTIILIFIYPLIRGFVKKYDSLYTRGQLIDFERSLCSLISIFTGLVLFRALLLDKSSFVYDFLSYSIKSFLDTYPWIIYLVGLPLTFFLIHKLFYLLFLMINSLVFFPIINFIQKAVKDKAVIIKRVLGALAEIPRAICNVIVLVFIFSLVQVLNVSNSFNTTLKESKLYGELGSRVVEPITDSTVAKAIPGIIDNTFKIKIQHENGITTWEDIKKLKELSLNNNQIIYYNGVTLDEGIKSNASIDSYAIELTQHLTSDRSKARALYTFIGSSIEYDDDKADRILNNDFSLSSGAIEAYSTGKGVCFDYACLYTAMARAVGLKVRIITGEGYNGLAWVSHAWNQVYLADENVWINVDPTFYKGGNYFNSSRFDQDHRNSVIAGEWQ